MIEFIHLERKFYVIDAPNHAILSVLQSSIIFASLFWMYCGILEILPLIAICTEKFIGSCDIMCKETEMRLSNTIVRDYLWLMVKWKYQSNQTIEITLPMVEMTSL